MWKWEIKALFTCHPSSPAWRVAHQDLGEKLWISYITFAFGLVILTVAFFR